MSAWLSRQRKGELLRLAVQAGISDYEGMLKDDLVTALDQHLRANASTLSTKPAFSEYYHRSGSPVKRERVATAPLVADNEPQISRQRRRTSKVKEEQESHDDSEPTPIKTLVARTPQTLQRAAERIPLPPSPAVIADTIDHQTALLRSSVNKAWTRSGITDWLEYVREILSSVVGIEAAALVLEGYGLQKETLPWRYAFDTPAVRALGLASRAVFVPDFFVLLTGYFWAPTVLWLGTSLLVPLVFAYFFNLTLRARAGHAGGRAQPARQFDPLMFNVAKALTTWLVYSQGFRFGGLIGNSAVMRVDGAVPGGYQGVMIGAGIGALTSIYEAVLKK